MRFMTSPAIVTVIALACLASGCTEVRPAQLPSAGERSASRALVEQIAALATQPTSQDDLLRAMAIQPLFTLLSPPTIPAAFPESSSGRQSLHRGGLDSCAIASSNAATFTDCALAGHMIDGTWSAQRPRAIRQRIHTELGDIFALDPGQHGSLALTATLARRTSQRSRAGVPRAVFLTGTIELDITWSADSTDYFLDAVVRVENLATSSHANYEHPCATGGAITVTGSFSSSSSSKTGDAALSPVTLSFGPTCQDLQITR